MPPGCAKEELLAGLYTWRLEGTRLAPVKVIKRQKVADALKHPNSMGPAKVMNTTLVNKGWKWLEAHFPVDLDYDRIDIVFTPKHHSLPSWATRHLSLLKIGDYNDNIRLPLCT